MVLAALAAVVLDREGDLLPAFALAALITLVKTPQALFDISFQLSYLSVLTIAFVVSTWNALALQADSRAGNMANQALLLFVISCAATLVTGPLVALYFNQFSFAGVIANMIIVPFASSRGPPRIPLRDPFSHYRPASAGGGQSICRRPVRRSRHVLRPDTLFQHSPARPGSPAHGRIFHPARCFGPAGPGPSLHAIPPPGIIVASSTAGGSGHSGIGHHDHRGRGVPSLPR